MIGYWPCVLLRFHGPGQSRCQRKRKRKDAILTKQALQVKDFLHGQEELFSCGTKEGNPVRLRYAHLALSGSKSEHRDSLDLTHSRIQPYYIKQFQIYL